LALSHYEHVVGYDNMKSFCWMYFLISLSFGLGISGANRTVNPDQGQLWGLVQIGIGALWPVITVFYIQDQVNERLRKDP